MRRYCSAILLSCAALTSCDSYSAREREAVERLKQQMLDPDTAQFRNVHEGRKRDRGWIVCGEVNTKNRFGGYTGFRKFSMTEKEGDVLFADESSAEGMIAGLLMQHTCNFPEAGESGE